MKGKALTLTCIIIAALKTGRDFFQRKLWLLRKVFSEEWNLSGLPILKKIIILRIIELNLEILTVSEHFQSNAKNFAECKKLNFIS